MEVVAEKWQLGLEISNAAFEPLTPAHPLPVTTAAAAEWKLKISS